MTTDSRGVRENNAALVREYLAWQRKRERSPHTLKKYTATLAAYLAWVGSTPLATVQVATMEAFVERPRVKRLPQHPVEGLAIGSPGTRSGDCTTIRSLHRYLADRGHLAVNAALLLVGPEVHNTQPKAIDDDVWRAVWMHKQLTDDERVMLGLGFFAGLRREEMLYLEVRHVNLLHGTVVGFVRKGGDEDAFALRSATQLYAERLPSLIGDPRSFWDPLARCVERGGAHLMWWADTNKYPNVVNKRLVAALRRCKLHGAEFDVHSLRHSFVTNLLRMGVPIQTVSKLANHQSIATTMRYIKQSVDPLAEYLLSPTRDETLQVRGGPSEDGGTVPGGPEDPMVAGGAE